MRALLFPFTCFWGLACGLSAPQVGQSLSQTSALATYEVRARHTDLVTVQTVFPADADGHPMSGPFPGVVFIQGGAVPVKRYLWQAQLLAEAGYVVALPEHPLELAFFAIDDGLAARQLLVSPEKGSVLDGLTDPGRLGVAGHSLGSVVAAKVAIAADFQALLFEAGYPDTADDDRLPFFHAPVASFAGGSDCKAPLTTVTEGFDRLTGHPVLAVFSGVTHYQFTDSDAEDVSSGCQRGVDLETAHARLGEGLRTFFGAALGPAPSTGLTGLRAIEGVEVTAK